MVESHTLVEALRIENLVEGQRARVRQLAEELSHAELIRQMLERELYRLQHPLVALEQAPVATVPTTAPIKPAPKVAPKRAPAASRTSDGSATGRKAIDETGNRYGKLLVIERAPNVGPNVRWRCGCDCGAEVLTYGFLLRQGKTTACPECRPSARKGPPAPEPAAAPEATRAAPSCRACGQPGHTARSISCPRRAKPEAPQREKKFTCYVCAGLPHRVQGVRCRGCGLEREDEQPARVTDFNSNGQGALARAM